MIDFGEPYWLFLLLLLPPLIWLRSRAGKEAAFLYSSVQLVRTITRLQRSRTGLILLALRWLAIALFIVGMARPRLDEGETTINASGIDIVVALDLSGSMAAEDFRLDNRSVNRVAIAKDVLAKFVKGRPADRIGLVAFAGRAYIATPLTLDHDFFLTNLERLDINQIEDGTAIGSALTAALNRLRNVDSKSKIVILMTDGQNTSGKVPPLTAAEAAEALGVKVYTIGVGTRGEARIPYVDPFGRRRYSMQPVDIDEETLRKIAAGTGAKYYRADNTDTLNRIYQEIDELEKSEVEVKKYHRYRELFPWVVVPGLFLILLEITLAHTAWRKLP